MKKIISMGIASAVLALTAIAASADIKADTADKAINGKTIKVQITTTADITDCGFYVAATGLEVENVDTTTTDGSTIMSSVKADGSVKVAGYIAPGTIKAGSVLATITYTVTAETGADVAVEIKNAEGYDEATQPFAAKVEAESTESTSESTGESTSESTGESTSESTGESTSESTGESTSESGSGEGGENVPTGVALAVVPAVLAGAAVVVAKKRK